MPIYEFKCEKCGKVYESIISLGVREIECDCGGKAKRIMSCSNFVLKGPGWAKDGYSKDSKCKCTKKPGSG